MNNIYRYFSHLIEPIFNNNIKRYVTFKSAVALETIYPNSSVKLTNPLKVTNHNGQFSGYIPMDELDITYSRSTGPGGQNVNTLNTKVDLRFNVKSASWINDEIKSKLLEKYRTKITKDGFLIFRSDLTRSQQLNLADCLEKVRSAIRTTIFIAPEMSEETHEKISRRHERAVRERLNIKRQRTQIKADRRDPTI